MGELLARAARQQALLDAWEEIHDDARDNARLDVRYEEFERHAARRLAELSDALLTGTWRPHPVNPVRIPKPGGGLRKLAVPTLEDRIVEKAVLAVLDRVVDPELLPWSFAYRRGLGVPDAVRSLLQARDDGAAWVARGDFTGCFDTIPRARVLDRLRDVVPDPELFELVRLLVYRPERGAPSSQVGLHQGSSLSPLLANLHLNAFDRAMLRNGWQVIRYSDDFAVATADRPAAEAALTAAYRAASPLGLQLSPEKCTVSPFTNGVPFLGELLTEGTATRTEASAHPASATVYVNEEGGLLRSRGNRLRLERGQELVQSLAFPRVRQVVVFGRVGMTTPFLQQVLIRGIDLVLLSDTGRYYGRLQGATATNPFLRQRQYGAGQDPGRTLDLAKRFVDGKLVNLRSGLLRARRRGSVAGVDELIDRLERARTTLRDTPTLSAVLGVEGAGSRDYFAGLAKLLDSSWEFTGRRRRPPPDPINSLLSLGYTLLTQEATAAVEAAGLDPYFGFLHSARVGRPSLALDLVEEFRPVLVDSVALRAVRTACCDRPTSSGWTGRPLPVC